MIDGRLCDNNLMELIRPAHYQGGEEENQVIITP